jgi:ATP-dependent helicase/nuclease subunit A
MLTQPVTRFDPAPPNAERVHFAGEVLTRLHRVAGRVPIAELLMRALEATGYLAAQAGLPDGARRVNNVEKLLEIARQSGRIGLGEFTAYLQDLTEREDRESEALVEAENLVRLMTIHASKGLEFPVVALFEANWERRPDKPLLLLDAHQEAACRVLDASGGWAEPVAYRRALHIAEARDRAEGKRLLYVALTRAQDYFIVCGRKEAGDGWLNQMAAALNLPDSIYPDAARQISFDWGAATLGIPLRSPEIGSQSALGDAENTAWEALDAPEALTAVASAASAASRPMTDPPPLLRTPVQDVQAPVRLLDSKELARLGEVRPDFSRFRNQVLHNAPADIRMVTQLAEELGQESGQPVVPGRVIGEIVHRALRFDRLPGNTPALNDILASYAWEHGIAQADAQDQVVKRCHDLLSRIERTWIMGQVRQAEQVYREVPFTFRTSERTINGIIDVLFFTRRQWHVLDYKTSYVALGEARDQIAQTLAAHAERYHQQVGVYAAAVEQKFGQMPQTHIHYVRYAYTVTISPAAGQAALNNLETDIREALQALQD